MKEKWLTTREAAGVLNISLQAVKKNAAKGKYNLQNGLTKNGQNGYLIAFSSLPIAAAASPRKEKAPAEKPDALGGCNDKQRAEAFQRLEILEQWKKFAKGTGQSQAAAADSFLGVIMQGKYGRTTLYRWKRDFQEQGILGLVPSWSNGQDAFNEEMFSPEAKTRAQQYFLKTSRISYKEVFKAVRDEGALKGWQVPSYDTVKRFLLSIPLPTRILLREGRKAFADKALPNVLRKLNDLLPMEIIESDHHQMDVAVIDKAGHIFFPWLTIWYDVASRKPLGWNLFSTPNSDGIRITLLQTIMESGVPGAVHIDNGKDYRAKIFRGEAGRFKIEKTEFKNDLKPSLIEGIYGSFGIKVHWAIPYNAKTKVIERFFRTLRTECSVWFRGYRGKNTIEKPEILAKQWRTGDVYPFDEFKLALGKWIDVEYSQKRPHQGLDMRPPNQVFAEKHIEKRTVSEEELTWLFSQYPRRMKIGRNGIYLFNDHYWSEKIAREHLDEWAMVRFNDNDLNRVYVTDEAGNPIGFADKRNPGSWKMETEEYKQHSRMVKAVQESTRPYVEISKSLTPADQEKLFLERIGKDGQPLPAVTERRVDTPFRHILEEDKRISEDRKKLDAEAREFGRMYATMPVEFRESDRQRAEREMDEFLKTYRRNT